MKKQLRRRTLYWALGFLVIYGLALLGMAIIAEAGPPEFVTICHAAGQEGTTQYVTLTLPYDAVYGPAGHFSEPGTANAGHEQDYEGPCIGEAELTATPVPTEVTDVPTDEPTPEATPTEESTPTPDPSATPPPTETPPGEETETPPPPVATPRRLPETGRIASPSAYPLAAWLIPGTSRSWAAHAGVRGSDAVIQRWVGLREYDTFVFNGEKYTVTASGVASPDSVHLLDADDLVLVTCVQPIRGADGRVVGWQARWVVLASRVQPSRIGMVQ